MLNISSFCGGYARGVCLHGLGVFLSLKLKWWLLSTTKNKVDSHDRWWRWWTWNKEVLSWGCVPVFVAPLCPMYATQLVYISCGCGCYTVAVEAAAPLQHVTAQRLRETCMSWHSEDTRSTPVRKAAQTRISRISWEDKMSNTSINEAMYMFWYWMCIGETITSLVVSSKKEKSSTHLP